MKKNTFVVIISILSIFLISCSAVENDENVKLPEKENKNVNLPEGYYLNGYVEGYGYYETNDQVKLEAVPDDGYKFSHWIDSVDKIISYENPYNFIKENDEKLFIKPVFTEKSYNFTINIVPENSGTVHGEGTYKFKEEISLEAIPNKGYVFDGWYMYDVEYPTYKEKKISLKMKARDMSIKAKFKKAYEVVGTVSYKNRPLENVSFEFSDNFEKVKSNKNGGFSKENLYGKVTITPKKEGFVFIPNKLTITDEKEIEFIAKRINELPIGKWRVSEKIDPLTNEKKIHIILEDEESQNSSLSMYNKRLIIRLIENKKEIYIDWNDYLADNKTIKYKFDNGSIYNKTWSSSTNNTALFFPSSSNYAINKFIRKLLKADKFIVAAKPYNEGFESIVFDTRYLANVLIRYLDYFSPIEEDIKENLNF